MNPSNKPQPEPRPVQDIKPQTGNTEVVNNIPVQSPVSKIFKPPSGEAQAADNGREFDHILQDVNSSVKQAGKPANAKPAKQPSPDKSSQSSGPIMATVAACIVALLLIAAAVMAYK